MVGCRYGAKNTLDQNYLYLAEKRGAVIAAESRVTDVRPIAAPEGETPGAAGYELVVERSTGWRHPRRTLRVKGVVVAAGSFGTVDLLARCKARGSLARLSDRLGDFVRTNSEALLAVRSRKKGVDYSKGIAITSGAYVDDKTHIEIVRYPSGSDAMSLLATVLTDDGPGIPRWLRWVGNVVRHPLQFLRALVPFGWAKKASILLVMQPVDSHLRYRLRRRWYWPFSKTLDSEHGPAGRVPVYLPIANQVARRMAEKMNGVPQSGIPEVLFGKATTAHILGGSPMGLSPEQGVVDTQCRAFGYENLFVVDGSIIPANLGVNPSLTITAMAEYAMSHVPAKSGGPGRVRDE
jgi:cholesterol oxidase